MNILFVGPYRNFDGWGVGAREFIRALKTTPHNIKIKPHFPAGKPGAELQELDILELEYTDIDNFDVVIQNTMPHWFTYDASFGKNIAWLPFETSGWRNVWPTKCNMMDEIWTTCAYSRKCLESSVKDQKFKTALVPIPTDVEKYKKEYPLVPESFTSDRFMFYFIGEYIERKNLDMLVRAFHLEFDRNENVGLLIKTNRSGMSPDQLTKVLSDRIEQIKVELSLYAMTSMYKNEVLITDRLSDEEIYGIHQSCHCFVMPSSGEGWNIPAVDAMGFGNTVVMTPNGAYEYAADYVIDYEESPVNTRDKPMSDLFNGWESWQAPSLKSLMRCMRNAFVNRGFGRNTPIDILSYSSVGAKICQML